MSDMMLSFLIAVGILTVLFVFVPLLHVCNAGCQRFFGRKAAAKRLDAGASERSSRGLAETV